MWFFSFPDGVYISTVGSGLHFTFILTYQIGLQNNCARDQYPHHAIKAIMQVGNTAKVSPPMDENRTSTVACSSNRIDPQKNMLYIKNWIIVKNSDCVL